MNKKYKVGLFIGKFLPPHIGHINQIKLCLNECETLIVVVADSKMRSRKICENAKIKTIYAQTRLKWLKDYFKKEKRIKFCLLDEGMLESFPQRLNEWKIKLKNTIRKNIDCWFVDKNYVEISKKYFPEYNFSGFDRSEIDINATEIRDSLENNICNIIPSAQKYFKKRLKRQNR